MGGATEGCESRCSGCGSPLASSHSGLQRQEAAPWRIRAWASGPMQGLHFGSSAPVVHTLSSIFQALLLLACLSSPLCSKHQCHSSAKTYAPHLDKDLNQTPSFLQPLSTLLTIADITNQSQHPSSSSIPSLPDLSASGSLGAA